MQEFHFHATSIFTKRFLSPPEHHETFTSFNETRRSVYTIKNPTPLTYAPQAKLRDMNNVNTTR
jgi:hypothetical protein